MYQAISENESNILVTSVLCIGHKKLQVNLETFKNEIKLRLCFKRHFQHWDYLQV
jgi:hypothetical protein